LEPGWHDAIARIVSSPGRHGPSRKLLASQPIWISGNIAVNLIRLAIVDSTQAFLARHPELGPIAILADEQTSGRGRGENRWESAPGAGLWLSAALPMPAVPPGLLLQRAMAAVIEALEPCGLKLGLKWPNDLVAWRGDRLVKAGGIIGEQKGDLVLLGLGVNLHSAPSIPGRPIPPMSLAELGAQNVPAPLDLARDVLERWEDLTVIREPAFFWPAQGDEIRWEDGAGLCEGWREDGQLAVQTAQGLQALCSGDVAGLTWA
jgi:BirA family biotin operon repressor/biotin-[acetyl-CoA-carboxylase] ligase